MKNGIQKITEQIFRRHIALPSDHGAWVFLFSPLLIGLFAGGTWTTATTYLVMAALAVFLLRQPVATVVKVYSRRRSRRDLTAAWFWSLCYSLIGLLALAGLLHEGYSYLLVLAIPGLLVFCWHLYLVSKRAERRQLGVEIIGSGVLALSAPAAYWVGVGYPDPLGWLMFALVWLQSAASIVHAYLRLEQRVLAKTPDIPTAQYSSNSSPIK
ncbi:MAG: YwiC-like family protein, partial [Anaerolineales bacterium]